MKDPTVEDLIAWNAQGNYRSVIRGNIAQDSANSDNRDDDAAQREVQFAVALQHAGFLGLAIDSYRTAMTLALGTASGLHQDLRDRVNIQLATLHERVGESEESWPLISATQWPRASPKAEIASMSNHDWYLVTAVKLCFRRADLKLAKYYMDQGRASTTAHARDWLEIFGLGLRILETNDLRDEDVATVENICNRYLEHDPPGEPWIRLFIGPLVARFNLQAAIDILERGAVHAQRLGKFFLFAASYEELTDCYLAAGDRLDEARATFGRSLNAYGKCHLLFRHPIRSRLARLGARLGIEPLDIGRLALQCSSLLFNRDDILFSEMCASRAASEGVEPYRVFEKFVETWAPTRFPGVLRSLPPGEEAADVLMTWGEGAAVDGIAIQAKHYSRPAQAIPKRNPRLRDLGDRYGATIRRYVFVVSTSAPGGWQDRMWSSQTSAALRNVVTDRSVAIQVVTEPELQTDVVLNDHLLRTYFNYLSRG